MALDDAFQAGTDAAALDLVQRPRAVAAPEPRFNAWRTGAAVPRGTAAGAAESGGFLADVVGAFGQVLAATDARSGGMFAAETESERQQGDEAARRLREQGVDFSSEAGDLFRGVARGYRPDAQTAHAAEQIVFNGARFLTKAVGYSVAAGGPVLGAVAVGADEASMVADDLRLQGVDLGTRAAAGAVQGLGAAAGVLVPVAGRTAVQTAALVAAGGPGVFIAQQAATRAILEHAGYSQLGEQFDPFDPVGLAVSTFVPAAFGAWGMRRARTARDRAAGQAEVAPEAIDAARVSMQSEQRQAHSLAEAADLAGQARHTEALARAEDQLARGEPVRVTDVVLAERAELGRAYDAVLDSPAGDRFDPLVMIRPEDIEAVAVSRGGWKRIGDAEVKGAGFGLVKFIWRHGEGSSKAPEMQVTREDVLAFPEVIRRYEPAEDVQGERGRAWRVERDGRTVVYADSVVSGAEGRHLVSVYVQEPGRSDTKVMSKERPNWNESPGKRLQAHTGDTGRTLFARRGSDQSGEGILADRLGGFSTRLRAGVDEATANQTALAPRRTREPAKEPAKRESRPPAGKDAAPDAGAIQSRLAELEAAFPDMQVMLDGMDAPMRLADFLQQVKAEADEASADAALYQLAAECALLNGR